MNRQVTVFDPFRMLSDDFFGRAGDAFSSVMGGSFPMDVTEDDDSFEVKVALPGFKKEEVKIDIEDRTITISASVEQKDEEKNGKRYLRREIMTKSFTSSYTLPTKVDSDSCKASFKDGVLTIDLPKAPEVKPKKIDISVA